ncbi:protein kinase domain-containing protein [Catenulispora subtropica]
MADGVLDGRYRLRTLLGRGGMGEVWRAHDTRIGREVAVKIVTRGGLSDEALARFDREARIAGNVSGPSIVTVHDYGHDEYGGETVPYLVMELVAGRTIAERVRADGPPSPRTALTWTLQVCEALTIAHAANIVHRDIKPSNVMVTDSGAVKVLDFGIARFMEHQQTRTGLTAAGMVIGSAEYMSPEQAQGHRVDARSDLYSLGCLLFYTLTGRAPFEADSPVGLAYQHVNKQAEPPSRYRIGIPPGVDGLALELMAKDPDVRPADAQSVGDRIRRLLTAEEKAEQAPGGGGAAAAAGAGAAGMAAGMAAGAGAGPSGTLVGPPATGQTVPGQPTGQTPVGQTGATPTGQPTGRTGPASAGQPVGATGSSAAGQTGAASTGQPVGATGSTGAGQPIGQPGQPAPGQTGSTAAGAFSGSPVAQAGSPTSGAPSGGPASRDTDFWMPGQDTQVTQVRHYPGESGGRPPGPPVSATAGPPAEAPHSRRWFIAGATAVAVSGAGVGAWLALGGKSSDKNNSVGFSQVSGNSSSAPPPSGSASASDKASAPSSSAGGSSSAAASPSSSASGASSSTSSAPHNPTPVSSLTGHGDDVPHVVFRADSQLLASCSFDHTAKLWDVSDPTKPRLLGTCKKHTDQVWNVAISPDGHTLATSSMDQTVVLWDIRDPSAPQVSAQVNLGNKLNGVAFSPDGGYLAVGTWGGTTRLIDLSRPTDPKGQYTLSGHTGLVYGVAYSPDGATLATGSFDKSVRLWDVSTPSAAKPLGSSTAHKDRVFDLAFHPSKPLLAVGSADHSLILFDTSDLMNPVVVKNLGEDEEVTGVAFSPDGDTVANGTGKSAQILLADVTTPAAPHVFDPLTGHKGYTYGVAFSPDGRLLASGSEDHTIRLWRF